ncbi:hypothetical protein BpHYR1_026125 [Brachionus plicatilis]|uniref:Uncharacterized protein n=1 Tax=Brachionus plicatilis TaxID=10195 RepID=A0A3M7T7L2_BRAPC|nr:hypothetical protein BpHYR1_026125 [Brachionus plicatilis]
MFIYFELKYAKRNVLALSQSYLIQHFPYSFSKTTEPYKSQQDDIGMSVVFVYSIIYGYLLEILITLSNIWLHYLFSVGLEIRYEQLESGSQSLYKELDVEKKLYFLNGLKCKVKFFICLNNLCHPSFFSSGLGTDIGIIPYYILVKLSAIPSQGFKILNTEEEIYAKIVPKFCYMANLLH